MDRLAFQQFATPAKWIMDLTNMSKDELMEYYPYEVNNLSNFALILDMSEDCDRLVTAMVCIQNILKRKYIDPLQKEFIITAINSLSIDRIIEIIQLRTDVMRECIYLFRWFECSPSEEMLDLIGANVKKDDTSIDFLVDAWLINNWKLTPSFVFIIEMNYNAWKLLHKFNSNCQFSSKSLLEQIHKYSNQIEYLSVIALIGVNSSAFEYIMQIDNNQLNVTLKTIEYFKLWKILGNAEAGPMIDYIINHHYKITSPLLNTKKEARDFVVKYLDMSPLISKYATSGDIESRLLSDNVFSNSYAIDIICEWTNEDNVTSHILEKLIDIIISNNHEAALKAINLFKKIFLPLNQIQDNYWAKLVTNTCGLNFAKEYLNPVQLVTTFISAGLLPYWRIMHYDNDEPALTNLTYETVKNLHLDITGYFEKNTRLFVYMLTYEDWCILFTTKFGVELGIEYIGFVVESGILYELLKSPFITPEQIIKLSESTDIFEYAYDGEFSAIISRHDAFEIDYKNIVVNYELKQELMDTFFNPDRIFAAATDAKLDLCTYLSSL